mmetsp:Transcript_30784/g.80627  ORF Transcript_30784/g.80627 Transcript_30784/m.80627 type:complete len:154 (-) Transcript_30784:2194-2655(-)
MFSKLIGGIFFGAIFLAAGVMKLQDPQSGVAALDAALASAQENSLPFVSDVARILSDAPVTTHQLILAASALEALAGALIILGAFNNCLFRTGVAAAALFLLAVTPIMHFPHGENAQMEQIMLMKNMSLFGACILLLAHSGSCSKTAPKEKTE